MSDIQESRRGANQTSVSQALAWLERYLRRRNLHAGSPLPSEMEIAQTLGIARSSLREALTILKAFGLVRSRRKGGMRLLRDPAILELRHYFAERLDTSRQREDAMEFRAAMERGMGEIMFSRIDAATVRKLHRIGETVRSSARTGDDIKQADIQFHTTLLATCGNRLATLFACLYEPIFHNSRTRTQLLSRNDVEDWVTQHECLVSALRDRDQPRFLTALREHTRPYMRLDRGKRSGSAAALAVVQSVSR